MKRVLILGGGFGGIATARRLKEKLDPNDEVILVDRRDHFMVGFRKTWALVGESTLEEGKRPLDSLSGLGIRVMRDPVTRIDPNGRAATMGDQNISADGLVVALGAELATGAIPGFQDFAYNVYDPQDIPRAAQALQEFQGGKVVIGIFGAPYKCPPAPYEMALLINDSLKARGIKASMEVFSPQPMSLPMLGNSPGSSARSPNRCSACRLPASPTWTMSLKSSIAGSETGCWRSRPRMSSTTSRSPRCSLASEAALSANKVGCPCG